MGISADRPRIALVDDDPSYLETMAEALEDQGYEALTYDWYHGYEPVEELRQKKLNLIVLDIRMGRVDSGWELLEQLQENQETKTIPLIVCSADAAQVRERAAWLADHGVAALMKPFDLNVLYELVARQLQSE